MAEHKRHQGHRQRMRERVQNYGLDSLAEHEALEYVLYLTNAQKDTNGIAHDLIDRFGDFAAVLEASEEELCTVEGVGPATARMLHLLPEISRYYGRSRTSTTRCIRTTEQMGSYLMAKFAWSDYERAMLVSLDSRKRVRAAVWLREGTTDRVSLDIKDVVSAAIKGKSIHKVCIAGAVAMAQKVGGFVQHSNVFVLINDIDLGLILLFFRRGLLHGFCAFRREKLVVDVQLDQVACLNAVLRHGLFSVYLHALIAEALVQKAGGKIAGHALHKAGKTNAVVVGGCGILFHKCSSIFKRYLYSNTALAASQRGNAPDQNYFTAKP